jgi:hypothetical protein
LIRDARASSVSIGKRRRIIRQNGQGEDEGEELEAEDEDEDDEDHVYMGSVSLRAVVRAIGQARSVKLSRLAWKARLCLTHPLIISDSQP